MRKSESWVSQTISLSSLPKCAIEALENGWINRTAALQFLKSKPDKIPEIVARARSFVEEGFIEQIKKAQEALTEKMDAMEAAEVELESVEIVAKKSNSKSAKRALDKAKLVFDQSNTELEVAAARLKKISEAGKSGRTGPAKSPSADDINNINEALGARVGAPKPYTGKRIREVNEVLADSLKDSNGVVKVDNKKYASRDVKIVYLVTEFLLGRGKNNNILSVIDEVDKK